jgi:hypothetical protein
LAQGARASGLSLPMDDAPAFVPVVAEPCHEAIPAPKANGCGTITIESGGTIVRAEPGVECCVP